MSKKSATFIVENILPRVEQILDASRHLFEGKTVEPVLMINARKSWSIALISPRDVYILEIEKNKVNILSNPRVSKEEVKDVAELIKILGVWGVFDELKN